MDCADTGIIAERCTIRDTITRNSCQLLALFHKGEGAIGADNNLIDQKTVQICSERGIAIALDDTFERVAILATNRNCRL